MKVPNKIKNFWWRACKNSLATKENLFKRKCAPTNLCPICDLEVETVEHMLFLCSWSKAVWFGCNIRVFGDLGGNASVIKWASEMVDKMPVDEATDFMGKVALVAWHLWKARNDFVFRKSKVNPKETLVGIIQAQLELSSTLENPRVQMDNPSIQEDNTIWRAPDKGKFKVNCDVALASNGRGGKIAVILRDWKGKVRDGFAKQITAGSSLKGELLAIRTACEMVISLGLKDVEVESDNRQAILLSVSESVPPWDVRAVVLDIRHLATKGSISFRWVRRQANKAAHEVAALALRNSLPRNWSVNPPLSLISVLCKDVSL